MGIHWGFDGGLGILSLAGILIIVLFWALVIAALVLGIRWLIRADQRGRLEPPASRPEDPLEILRRRYAAGEIDDEEYARRRKTLRG
jgi:putative membrane protein